MNFIRRFRNSFKMINFTPLSPADIYINIHNLLPLIYEPTESRLRKGEMHPKSMIFRQEMVGDYGVHYGRATPEIKMDEKNNEYFIDKQGNQLKKGAPMNERKRIYVPGYIYIYIDIDTSKPENTGYDAFNYEVLNGSGAVEGGTIELKTIECKTPLTSDTLESNLQPFEAMIKKIIQDKGYLQKKENDFLIKLFTIDTNNSPSALDIARKLTLARFQLETYDKKISELLEEQQLAIINTLNLKNTLPENREQTLKDAINKQPAKDASKKQQSGLINTDNLNNPLPENREQASLDTVKQQVIDALQAAMNAKGYMSHYESSDEQSSKKNKNSELETLQKAINTKLTTMNNIDEIRDDLIEFAKKANQYRYKNFGFFTPTETASLKALKKALEGIVELGEIEPAQYTTSTSLKK